MLSWREQRNLCYECKPLSLFSTYCEEVREGFERKDSDDICRII